MYFGLTIVLVMVLLLPFAVKSIESNLESFLFTMGVLAVVISGVLNKELLSTALSDPINITFAVIIAGLLFRLFQKPFEKVVRYVSRHMPFPLFVAIIVIGLGIVSSVITAIIAAIILVAIVSVLNLSRKDQIRMVVITCFSIGMGAVLTPVGEPLSTIATSKMNETFFYLLKLLGVQIIPGIFAFGILAAIIVRKPARKLGIAPRNKLETIPEIIIRGIKVYIFVMALTLLGAGFEPFIERFLLNINLYALYWINMVSAVLDNATLVAAEISPEMSESTIQAILLGLIISGGMLIPGNIPNIIAAGKLQITSIEWARIGVPVGLLSMIVYFIVIVFS
ncbi:DUF1646 family protein [Sporosarcina sp. Sa2YVA2]|uniref:DUF1646 family protein n=1 Tax=Sporosarcina quadrami TaxID=2762234 RepID=A0ABR8U5G7_9BACL|nr:DUF1646 family protein [Sporosarcina quadrami]MBD7983289.1 DUF1646 family protein [Sporosarcina quadrami]